MEYSCCNYVVDKTLFNHWLLKLKNYEFFECPAELKKNKNITVKLLIDNQHIYTFNNCHIDNTDNRRLRLPFEAVKWLRSTFPFSAAYYSIHISESIGNKKQYQELLDAKNGKKKMDIPRETICIRWVDDNVEKYLEISEGFRITKDNATNYLSEKALASILPYIFSSVTNVSEPLENNNGSKCYCIDQTTDWLPVNEYDKTAFAHPGLYILRRKDKEGYAYYIGKADDIKKRIIKNKNKVAHPEEKYEDNKQYDDITCLSVKFDDFIRLYGELNDDTRTPDINPGVKRGSDTDKALYAIEDVAIHVAAMIMKSEGKRLDNKQYRQYTSNWIQ